MKFRLRRIVDGDVESKGHGNVEPAPSGVPDPGAVRYRLRYRHDGGPTGVEIHEIEQRLIQQGYVLLWSTVLNDLVAFYQADDDRKKIPAGFTPYSEKELWELFGDDRTVSSAHSLRLIHQAKRLGAEIIPTHNMEEQS